MGGDIAAHWDTGHNRMLLNWPEIPTGGISVTPFPGKGNPTIYSAKGHLHLQAMAKALLTSHYGQLLFGPL